MSEIFVGRERELQLLRSGLDAVLAGSGRTVLVAGEPGIGKSRLCLELAQLAEGQGAQVLWGRCWESGGAPAYWPWRQALKSMDTQSNRAVSSLLEESHGEAKGMSGDAARFSLFQEVTTALRDISSTTPVVLILEDLHAADIASLLLLKFLAREIHDARIMLLLNFRDLEARQQQEIAAALGAIAREGERIPLGGLSKEEVADFVERSGIEASSEMVARIAAATEGNPLYVKEVVRTIASGREHKESEIPVPEGVREAVKSRTAMLSNQAEEVLAAASVLGRDFDLGLLTQMCGLQLPNLLDLLKEGQRASVIDEVTTGTFRFSHGLVRQCLYDELSPSRRVGLHRQAAETLESLLLSRGDVDLSELAFHYARAVPAGTSKKAIDFGLKAAERAMSLLAFEQAASLYGDVLTASVSDLSSAATAEILLSRSEAFFRAGSRDKAREDSERAFELGRSVQSPQILARAALSLGLDLAMGEVDLGQAALLKEAIGSFGQHDDPLLARSLARLARALYWEPDSQERSDLSRRGVEMARRLGDASTLAEVLPDRHVAVWGPHTLEERLHLADEIISRAQKSGSKDLLLEGLAWRAVDRVELGQFDGARSDMNEYVQLASSLNQPHYLWRARLIEASVAFFEGDLELAEQLADDALEISNEASDPMAMVWHIGLMTVIRHSQGRLSELEARAAGLTFLPPSLAIPLRSTMSAIYAMTGRTEEALEQLSFITPDDFGVIRSDNGWLPLVSGVSEVINLLALEREAKILYGKLRPYLGRHVPMARFVTGTLGPLARYLGLLALTSGELDIAVDHFEEAAASLERTGVMPWRAQTQLNLGTALMKRDLARDKQRALSAFSSAFEIARTLHLETFVEQILEALTALGLTQAEIAKVIAAAPGETKVEELTASFRRDESHIEIAFDGIVARLRGTKGLSYIQELLRRPSEELHALELSSIGSAPAKTSAREDHDGVRLGTGDSGPLLDAKAKASYRTRLRELQEELEEAEAFGNEDATNRARAEIEDLTSQLAGALGLGGRDRRAASDAERARVSVTKAIRASIRSLRDVNPALGEYLAASIRTGFFCSYQPESRVRWEFGSAT